MVTINTSLFFLGYLVAVRPMSSRTDNYLEILNEFYHFLSIYFLFIYTDWISDPEDRYSWGATFNTSLIVVGALNFVIIFGEIIYTVYRNLKYRGIQNKWVKYTMLKTYMICELHSATMKVYAIQTRQ